MVLPTRCIPFVVFAGIYRYCTTSFGKCVDSCWSNYKMVACSTEGSSFDGEFVVSTHHDGPLSFSCNCCIMANYSLVSDVFLLDY